MEILATVGCIAIAMTAWNISLSCINNGVTNTVIRVFTRTQILFEDIFHSPTFTNYGCDLIPFSDNPTIQANTSVTAVHKITDIECLHTKNDESHITNIIKDRSCGNPVRINYTRSSTDSDKIYCVIIPPSTRNVTIEGITLLIQKDTAVEHAYINPIVSAMFVKSESIPISMTALFQSLAGERGDYHLNDDIQLSTIEDLFLGGHKTTDKTKWIITGITDSCIIPQEDSDLYTLADITALLV